MKNKRRADRPICSPRSEQSDDTNRAGRTDRAERADRTAQTLVCILAASAAVGGIGKPLLAQSPNGQAVDGRLQTRRFDIPAGSLDSAVAAFARVTGFSITDPAALTAGVRSPGAMGTFTIDEALRHLLGGTGVSYRFTNIRAVALVAGPLPPDRSSAQSVAGMTVTASREPVVPSAKYTEPLADVPQTITVIPSEVITARGDASLRDVMKNVPGITITAGEGGSPPGDNFNIRGFSARSDLFVDGVRDLGGYSRDAYDLEQVKVAEGPASAYSGRGSTGGEINLVTKTPHLGDARDVAVTGGSSPGARVTADVDQPLAPLGVASGAFRLNVMRSESAVAGDDRIHNGDWGVAPSLALGLGTATQFDISYERTRQDTLPAYGLSSQDSIPTVDTRHFFGLPTLDFERVNADRAAARVDRAFANGMQLREQLTSVRSAAGRIVTTANLSNGAGSSKTHRSNDDNLDDQITLTGSFGDGALRHDVVAGVDVSREMSLFGHYTIAGTPPAVTDLADPDPALDYRPAVTLAPDPRQVAANSLGVYAFDTLKMGEHVELTSGARWDDFAPTFHDSTTHAVPEARNPSGRLGLVVKPTENGNVYAAYGTSFNPSIQDLAYDNLTTLPPEENRSIEVGTKWNLLRRRLLATFALFRTDKTNARTPDPDDPSVNILAGKQRVQGAEASVSGNVTRNWAITGGYTRLESRVLSSGTATQVGTPIANTPTHSASVWSTYRLPGGVEVGAGVTDMGLRFLKDTTYVPGYRTVDAEVSRQVERGVALRLNLYNLGNALYYDNGRFWVPGAARSVALTTTIAF
jgi:catecholate siderophore receptor